MKKKLWFKAKHYGWGWYPCAWQGWLILLLWVFVFAIILRSIQNAYSFILVTISVLVLIYICYKTGEKPRWRWG